MITSRDLNSTLDSSRMRFHLDRFRRAPHPSPDNDNWDTWKALLGSREKEPSASFRGAMNVETDYGFGTVSSSLIALPNVNRIGAIPKWLYCPNPPDKAEYKYVQL